MATNRHPVPLERTAFGHLTPEARALVYSCRDYYTERDTAEYFGVSRGTVRYAWQAEPSAFMPAPPNIEGTRATPDLILADTQILLDRGLMLSEVAEHLGTSSECIYHAFRSVGRRYYFRNAEVAA